MESFEERANEIKRQIVASIEQHRIAGEIVGNVIKNTDSRTIHDIWKRSGACQIERSPGGGVTVIEPPLERKSTNIIPIVVEQKGDFVEFFRDQGNICIASYLGHLGMQVAHRENGLLIASLIEEAREFPTNGTRLTRSDILVAAHWVGSNQCYPNTVVVNPEHELELVERKEIISRWSFSPQQWGKKDPHCCGILNGMDVYSTPHIPKGLSLVYDKNETFLSRTPLIIMFDDLRDPRSLLIEERCAAWARNNNGLAKVSVGGTFDEGASDHRSYSTCGGA